MRLVLYTSALTPHAHPVSYHVRIEWVILNLEEGTHRHADFISDFQLLEMLGKKQKPKNFASLWYLVTALQNDQEMYNKNIGHIWNLNQL